MPIKRIKFFVAGRAFRGHGCARELSTFKDSLRHVDLRNFVYTPTCPHNQIPLRFLQSKSAYHMGEIETANLGMGSLGSGAPRTASSDLRCT